MSIQKLMRCSIGIIVPFENLVPEYKQVLSRLKFVSNLDIQIGLPHDFEGVEKDVIILSHLRNSQIDKLGHFSPSK